MTQRTCNTCGDSIENIIELVEHGCDQILSVEDLTYREQQSLTYLENRVVDHKGELDHHQMNHDDRQSIKVFEAVEILSVEEFTVEEFTDRAWELAWGSRKLRADSEVDSDRSFGTIPGESNE